MLHYFTNLHRCASPTSNPPFNWQECTGGELAVRDGIIVGTPWGERVSPLPDETAIMHDCTGLLLLPGFVDSHTHLVYAGNRAHEFVRRCNGETYRDIAQTGGGIRYTVRQTRAASREQLVEGVRNRLWQALNSGTTSIEVKASYGLDLATDLKQLEAVHIVAQNFPGNVIPTCLSAHEFPDEYLSNRAGYIDLLLNEILPAVWEQGIAHRADIYCEDKVFSIEESRKILSRAKQLGFDLTMHADQWTDLGGAALAAELEVRSADHLESTGNAGLAELAKAGVVANLLPGSVWFANAQHYPNALDLIERGIPIALSSDHNPGSSMPLSMPLVLTIAALGCKLTGAAAITAATLGGATALGIAKDVGSIEVGKHADFTLWRLHHEDEIAYRAGSVLPVAVYCRGEKVVDRSQEWWN